MEKNTFWNKISELYYQYELLGIDKFIILNLTDGMEISLSVSSISIGADTIMGVLDDGTELIISIDEICTLRHNPNWTEEIINTDVDFI